MTKAEVFNQLVQEVKEFCDRNRRLLKEGEVLKRIEELVVGDVIVLEEFSRGNVYYPDSHYSIGKDRPGDLADVEYVVENVNVSDDCVHRGYKFDVSARKLDSCKVYNPNGKTESFSRRNLLTVPVIGHMRRTFTDFNPNK